MQDGDIAFREEQYCHEMPRQFCIQPATEPPPTKSEGVSGLERLRRTG
ncbi:MAG: hypothetical protein HOM71_10405 [Deltaproteobacteria bacterium]|nr:hypothetical protein [Deltaproteobacteria bacterium]